MTKQPQALTPSEMRFHDFYATATDFLDYRVATIHRDTKEIESKIDVKLIAFEILQMAKDGHIVYEGFDSSLIVVTDMATIPKQNKRKFKISAPLLYWLEADKLIDSVTTLTTRWTLKYYPKSLQSAGKKIRITRK